LQAGSNIGRLAQRQLFLPGAGTDLAHDHLTRMDAQAHREGHPALLGQARIEWPQSFDHLEHRPHRPRGFIFVRFRVAEVDEQAIEGVELLVIQVELDLQRPIGHPPALLEQGQDVVVHFVEVHHRPSTCASTASACGSQNVISMARYISMAVDRAARACSSRPILA
jgi:hypothetical protein